MNYSNPAEELRRSKHIVTTTVGVSMLPLIKSGRDSVCVSSVDRRLKKLDVALFRRNSGVFVLHRVVEVLPDGYVLCGDNQVNLELGITDENITGVMTGFFRGETYISCQNPLYRLYSHVWAALFPLRQLYFALRQRINQCFKKVE